ncbi:MAG: hypothetical protein II994_02835 [Lachnospiraceae bacterium]|nr:hypothetical protein [Lachnospiraceae bacterium]
MVAASGKNERGYLLYDADSRERIKQIKLFQELGFKVCKDYASIVLVNQN